jgi:hypothetical protein
MSNPAADIPPAAPNTFKAWFIAEEVLFCGVVVTTAVTVVDCVPDRVTEEGKTAQRDSVGAPEQVRVTTPLKVEFEARLNGTEADCPSITERVEVAGDPSVNAGGSAAITTETPMLEVAALKLPSPLYFAVMLLVPTESAEVVSAAELPVRATVPSRLPLS